MQNQKLHLTLPKNLARFVSSKIRSGEYAGEEDVICDSLELLKSMEAYSEYRLRRLRNEMRKGLEEAEAGLTRPWDKQAMDRIRSKGRKLLAANRKI